LPTLALVKSGGSKWRLEAKAKNKNEMNFFLIFTFAFFYSFFEDLLASFAFAK
jgi:hypothetical protein